MTFADATPKWSASSEKFRLKTFMPSLAIIPLKRADRLADNDDGFFAIRMKVAF